MSGMDQAGARGAARGFRVSQLRLHDVANGPGVRASLFVSGCHHGCPGCFNKLYQDPCYGEVWDEAHEAALMEQLKRPYISGLTLLGGEPMESCVALAPLVARVRAIWVDDPVPRTIWIYSGDRFEAIVADPDKRALLALCDVLVDGLFVEALKDLSLPFRGSSNQRVVDVRASLAAGACVLSEWG